MKKLILLSFILIGCQDGPHKSLAINSCCPDSGIYGIGHEDTSINIQNKNISIGQHLSGEEGNALLGFEVGKELIDSLGGEKILITGTDNMYVGSRAGKNLTTESGKEIFHDTISPREYMLISKAIEKEYEIHEKQTKYPIQLNR